MNKQHNQNQKQYIINRYYSGEGVTILSEETGVSRSTIYNWLKVERQLREKKAAEKEERKEKRSSRWHDVWVAAIGAVFGGIVTFLLFKLFGIS